MKWIFKLVRTLLAFVLALVALALTAVVVVMLKPDWRMQVVDRTLEEATGWKWSFDTTEMGWNRFAGTGVFVLQGAQGVQAEAIDLKVDFLAVAQARTLEVSTGEISGALIDLSSTPPAALGLSAAELNAIPRGRAEPQAADLLVEAALGRLAAQGVPFHFQNLTVNGIVLLPQTRGLEFEVFVVEATSEALHQAEWEVRSAVFR
jgi:hypothetical protein